ncbi:MAG TPA: phospholipase, partial [Pseudomonas sp.]|nr:phospholipase [Pseudomonas sp.]
NTRSMQADSELNIAHEWASETQKLRRRLWELHTDGEGMQDNPSEAFESWEEILQDNKDRLNLNDSPRCPVVEFFYDKATLRNLD